MGCGGLWVAGGGAYREAWRGGLFFGYGDGLGVLEVSRNLLGAERKGGKGEGRGGENMTVSGGGGGERDFLGAK